MFLIFLYSSVPDNKYHKQKWCILFFTCIKLVVHVLVCVCNGTHQMEKTGNDPNLVPKFGIFLVSGFEILYITISFNVLEIIIILFYFCSIKQTLKYFYRMRICSYVSHLVYILLFSIFNTPSPILIH